MQLAEGWLYARHWTGWGWRDAPGLVLPSWITFTCLPALSPSPDLSLGPPLYGTGGDSGQQDYGTEGEEVTKPLLGAWPSARGFTSIKETNLCPSTPVGKNNFLRFLDLSF